MERAERPVIGFLTDFGLDGAAATCRGVILSICRDAQIVDISHTVRKFAIRDGAFVLRSALPYLPVGVHLAVVDPGVGTARRPVGIRTTRSDVLIGPNNGLLIPAAEALGGIEEARELANRDLWLPITTSTFHGRDVFAPVAAHLANAGATFEEVGPRLEAGLLARLAEPTVTAQEGRIATSATYVDSFGNVRLAGGKSEVELAFGELRIGDAVSVDVDQDAVLEARFAPSFGHVHEGTLLLYIDSSGNLALGVNQGDLASRSGIGTGARVTITRPDGNH
ncbi:MAG TPA: SAM-dependent chlorinase/fluorinase [Candidatus Binatia bacterium]|nr:SAM-dependent chlorinase/fluorinase [Candidatus Binatia bacterium]